ncbi:Fur family transcriptional regulator [Atopobium minutum]|uniref:Fur family transcriptional regulator n=2 Tax=Atopobium minutum TaxID=1381 RepID=UPI0025F806C5|nr:transcriptional repressor [Atopobium minutum]
MRTSKQREAIRTYMRDRHDHPTADQVYVAVRKEFPNISLGTVYRNLMQLVEMGELIQVETGDTVSRFDCLTTQHSHFRCTSCGKVFDLEAPERKQLACAVKAAKVGQVQGFSLYFTGLCSECLAKTSAADKSASHASSCLNESSNQ